jgi:acetate kinase
LDAISHRVVHGGAEFDQPVEITPAVFARLEGLAPLAPLHQPHNLAVIRAAQALAPKALQVACFDTAFHRTMPAVAQRLGLPRAWEAAGVRRYGFHGLSYAYLVKALHKVDPELAQGRVVFAHLGSGASLCATRAGRSVETTMSFSTLDGLVMGSRCGALDPGAVLHLLRQGLTAEAIETLLYERSGLLGVSGLSGDMRVLLASDDPAAGEAVELFAYRAACQTGAMAAALGGLDGVVFTAGIGENSAEIRSRICRRLGWLGVSLDPEANAAGLGRISAADSRAAAWVIPTDEEQMLAEGAWGLFSRAGAGPPEG